MRHASLAEMIRDRETTLRGRRRRSVKGTIRCTGSAPTGGSSGGTSRGERPLVDRRGAPRQHRPLPRRAAGVGLRARADLGRVTAGRLDPGTLAVAVKGACGADADLVGREAGQFRALVPETAFRPGANDVEVFLVEGIEER